MVHKNNSITMEHTIKKGRHYGWHFFKIFFTKNSILKYDVTFTPSCLYSFGDVDDFDVNKLFGRSFGMHHQDSVRFGWRPDKNKIAIFSYTYTNGKRDMNQLFTCDIGKKYTMSMDCKENLAILEIVYNQSKIRYAVDVLSKKKWGYKLYPYFGGNKTAPQDVNIYLD